RVPVTDGFLPEPIGRAANWTEAGSRTGGDSRGGLARPVKRCGLGNTGGRRTWRAGKFSSASGRDRRGAAARVETPGIAPVEKARWSAARAAGAVRSGPAGAVIPNNYATWGARAKSPCGASRDWVQKPLT